MYFPSIRAAILLGPVFTLVTAIAVPLSNIPQLIVGDYDLNVHNALPVPDNHNHNFDHDQGACLRACFDKEPACPLNMEATKLNPCWTCCLLPQNDKSTISPDTAADKAKSFTDNMIKLEGATKQTACLGSGRPCCTESYCDPCCKGMCMAFRSGYHKQCFDV
ncbi:hypothetical protein BJX99DRAFT_219668 [Aspergillus californicus]